MFDITLEDLESTALEQLNELSDHVKIRSVNSLSKKRKTAKKLIEKVLSEDKSCHKLDIDYNNPYSYIILTTNGKQFNVMGYLDKSSIVDVVIMGFQGDELAFFTHSATSMDQFKGDPDNILYMHGLFLSHLKNTMENKIFQAFESCECENERAVGKVSDIMTHDLDGMDAAIALKNRMDKGEDISEAEILASYKNVVDLNVKSGKFSDDDAKAANAVLELMLSINAKRIQNKINILEEQIKKLKQDKMYVLLKQDK